MNYWFTSDLHLGHTNLAGPKVSKWPSGYRTFDTVHDMDEELITTFNKYVSWNDTVYHLGDFCMGSDKQITSYRSRLLVEDMHSLIGNHDKWVKKMRIYPFTTVEHVAKITIEGTIIFMSHYAHRVWPHSHKGCIHLYGHSHSNLPDYGKSMDVGVDNAYKMHGEYRPFNLDEIVEIMKSKTVEKPDHHGNREGEE